MLARHNIYDAITEVSRKKRERVGRGKFVNYPSKKKRIKTEKHGIKTWNTPFVYVYFAAALRNSGNDSLTLAAIWHWKLRTLIKRQWTVTRSRYRRGPDVIRRFLVRPIARTNCKRGGERTECYQLRSDQSAIVAGN